MHDAAISAIYRYPLKGFSPQPMQTAAIRPEETLALDRAYAVENGSRDFDVIKPKFLPKAKFLQLMTHEQLAALQTQFDEATGNLRILRDGKQVAAGNLALPVGRQLIEQFLSAYLGSAARGAPRIVACPQHHFADVPDNFISLVNLASIREIERVIGRPLDPLRFRANIYVDGWEPWAERSLIGATLRAGADVGFHVAEPIGRCAATNVDPQTGARDVQIPRTLNEVFGHDECGIYLTASEPGTITTGDNISLVRRPEKASAGHNLGIR